MRRGQCILFNDLRFWFYLPDDLQFLTRRIVFDRSECHKMLVLLELVRLKSSAHATDFEQVGRKDILSDIYYDIATLLDINQLPRLRYVQNKTHNQDLLASYATPHNAIKRQ
jgi:hypothetical protein